MAKFSFLQHPIFSHVVWICENSHSIMTLFTWNHTILSTITHIKFYMMLQVIFWCHRIISKTKHSVADDLPWHRLQLHGTSVHQYRYRVNG